MSPAPIPIEVRIWDKVDKNGPVPEFRPDLGPCWMWTGAATAGRGSVMLRQPRRAALAYRVIYELLVGPIPEGLVMDHLCRVPLCVNPAHLEPVTQSENVLRGFGAPHMHRSKTHCPQGHPYDDENTYRFGPDKKWRACRACSRESDRRVRERRAG